MSRNTVNKPGAPMSRNTVNKPGAPMSRNTVNKPGAPMSRNTVNKRGVDNVHPLLLRFLCQGLQGTALVHVSSQVFSC